MPSIDEKLALISLKLDLMRLGIFRPDGSNSLFVQQKNGGVDLEDLARRTIASLQDSLDEIERIRNHPK